MDEAGLYGRNQFSFRYFKYELPMSYVRRDVSVFLAGCEIPVPPGFVIMWNNNLTCLSYQVMMLTAPHQGPHDCGSLFVLGDKGYTQKLWW